MEKTSPREATNVGQKSGSQRSAYPLVDNLPPVACVVETRANVTVRGRCRASGCYPCSYADPTQTVFELVLCHEGHEDTWRGRLCGDVVRAWQGQKSIFLGIDRAVGQGYTRALYLPQDRRASSSTEWAGGFHRCRVADKQDPRHRVAMVSSRGR